MNTHYYADDAVLYTCGSSCPDAPQNIVCFHYFVLLKFVVFSNARRKHIDIVGIVWAINCLPVTHIKIFIECILFADTSPETIGWSSSPRPFNRFLKMISCIWMQQNSVSACWTLQYIEICTCIISNLYKCKMINSSLAYHVMFLHFYAAILARSSLQKKKLSAIYLVKYVKQKHNNNKLYLSIQILSVRVPQREGRTKPNVIRNIPIPFIWSHNSVMSTTPEKTSIQLLLPSCITHKQKIAWQAERERERAAVSADKDAHRKL